MQTSSRVPRHVAIIMDGNGRWAQNQGLSRTEGHSQGEITARALILSAKRLGIETLTLYCFSTENWKRPQEEVSFLFELLRRDLEEQETFYMENNIRLLHVGSTEGLSLSLIAAIKAAVYRTRNNTGITVGLALNYGGRDELVRAMGSMSFKERFLHLVRPSKKQIEAIYDSRLDTEGLGDVDMLIRTGGDRRLSNFLLWQSAYAELFFTETLWPDYSEEELVAMVEEFGSRDRRFGAIHE